MNDLTEQWKKGELQAGYYYVKDGENMIAEYLDGYFYNDGLPMTSFSGGVDSVLALVPSYEQWQAKLEENTKLKTENKWYSEQLNEAVKEIEKLKELLKECREILLVEEMVAGNPRYIDELRILIKRINQVLGEE